MQQHWTPARYPLLLMDLFAVLWDCCCWWHLLLLLLMVVVVVVVVVLLSQLSKRT
jgi:hypothetical protein